jgi:hypothetical protein
MRRLTGCVGMLLIPVIVVAAHAQSLGQASDMPIDKLKTLYLDCEQKAMIGKPGMGEIMLCSVYYEELKRRAFDGDFKRVRTWSEGQARVRQ